MVGLTSAHGNELNLAHERTEELTAENDQNRAAVGSPVAPEGEVLTEDPQGEEAKRDSTVSAQHGQIAMQYFRSC